MNDSLPLWAVFEVTGRCQLRCRHCSSNNLLMLDELTTRLWIEIINDFAANGCAHITYSGGEPLLRQDIFSLVSYSNSIGIETSLTSNGSAINAITAECLSECGIDGVQISIEGLKETHEFIRGKGTFSSAINAIGHLLNTGINASTMTVLSRLNIHELPVLAKQMNDLGVSHMAFERLTPIGRGSNLRSIILTPSELEEAFSTLQEMQETGLPIHINDPLRILVDEKLQKHVSTMIGFCGGCLAGIATCAVTPDGRLKACTRTAGDYGRLSGSNLLSLWEGSLTEFKLQRATLKSCMPCEYYNACGGCRAEIEAEGQHPGTSDPGCWIIN